jgi:hypothetical protein
MWMRFLISIGFVLSLAAIAVAADDPFTGTWRDVQQQASQQREPLTIKIDGDVFDASSCPAYPGKLTIKLDGNESKTGLGEQTVQAKRIDDQTIEIIKKGGFLSGTILYQVKGNILTLTYPGRSPDNKSSKIVKQFERVK